VDNLCRPEEGLGGGICNKGVDHVCVTRIACNVSPDCGDGGTEVAGLGIGSVGER
jgi:hypothetical protein